MGSKFLKDSSSFTQCVPEMTIDFKSNKISVPKLGKDLLNYCLDAIMIDLNIYVNSKWKIHLLSDFNKDRIDYNHISIIAENNIWNDIICGKSN